jgi:beta-lactamase class A
MQRRTFITASLAAWSSTPLFALARSDAHAAQLMQIEKRTGGRLGVAAHHLVTGRALLYRADERFPMCSTFKFPLAAAVLERVDAGHEKLSRRISYGKIDLLQYAPVTRAHVSQGFMTVGELCAAAIEYSDNTAANLLLREIGGPGQVTHYARSIGDAYTTLNRTEPALNTAIPGDVRDTTTPASMAGDLRKLIFGDALSSRSASALRQWMFACKTGSTRLRAGVPRSWRVGDKTGTGGATNRAGDSDTRNDVAFAQTPNGPVVIAVYLTRSQLAERDGDAAIAEVGRVAASALA